MSNSWLLLLMIDSWNLTYSHLLQLIIRESVCKQLNINSVKLTNVVISQTWPQPGRSQDFATGDKRGVRPPAGSRGRAPAGRVWGRSQMIISSYDGGTCTHIPPVYATSHSYTDERLRHWLKLRVKMFQISTSVIQIERIDGGKGGFVVPNSNKPKLK